MRRPPVMQVRQMTQPGSRRPRETMRDPFSRNQRNSLFEGGPRAGASGGSLTRRRAIRMTAAAAGLPLLIAAVRAAAPAGQLYHWQGDVLGAVSELTLWHTDAALAQRTIFRVRGEIARYERIFSLYQPESEISRLNAEGALARPSPELRGLVDASQRLSILS